MGKLIFVIDDEKDIRNILKVNLAEAGYDVKTSPSAEEALPALGDALPDLIILDIMMGGMDGYEFCRRLRSSDEYRAIPIIFLSARTEEFDRVLGLELGGDDYVSKPFGIKELLSRVKAVLRRAEPREAPPQEGAREKLKYKDLELSPENFQATIEGRDLQLTKSEFLILNLFMKYPGKIFTRDNIINSIRGEDVYVIDRTIDVHIMNIRKKLGPYKRVIKTLSGIGYGFKE
ncbi:MAG: response regulator transcription factor [Spirochaetes bacterium]|nr:response regulator transcription factor [Spirochaetota bacterium]